MKANEIYYCKDNKTIWNDAKTVATVMQYIILKGKHIYLFE